MAKAFAAVHVASLDRLRIIRASAAALLVLTLALVGVLVSQPAPAHAAEADTIYALVNQSRADAGLAPLQRNPAIDAVAVNWANQMAASNKMSHNPDFSTQIPSGWNSAGENVAQGQSSGSDVHIAWMNSAGHRANILGDYTDVGIAFISASGTTWGVEVFGRYADHVGWAPAPAAPAAAPAPAEPAAPAVVEPTPAATPPATPAPVATPAPAPSASALASAPRRSGTADQAGPPVGSAAPATAGARSGVASAALISGGITLPAAAATGAGTLLGGVATWAMILMRRIRPIGVAAVPVRRRPAHRLER